MATNKPMDYKYIEQLIERYFNAQTTLQEEQILRDFFLQQFVPQHLRQWQRFFVAEHQLSLAHLDQTFDERLLALTGEVHVHAVKMSMAHRLRHLYKVAACVALIMGIGIALERSSSNSAPSLDQTEVSLAQDELDPEEATILDIQSAEVETIDSYASGRASNDTTAALP